ncbi:hypothetical protein Atai01_80570 [Amycolatopsis taiwanensis]|uniref:Membrane-associated oxidoreductase n=2 Tax=Amycolatopsis taiwanensis TaxID=342230 RepID=A0A9W6VH17_9PSEU|nr:hypothetical protein Atai01_80570 [Amycolatopsis taiwanensis]
MARMTVDDLNESERELVLAVLAGRFLDFSKERFSDETGETGETGEKPEIRGELLRRIMLGRFEWPGEVAADPRGIRLRGAHLVGGLDLAEIESSLPLWLLDCTADQPVRFTGAKLSTVDLSGLVAPRLVADEVTIERSLTLRAARLGDGSHLAVHLGGARIGGLVNFSGAHLVNTVGAALQASNLRTGGGVFLNRGFRAEGTGEGGVVRLPGAVIGTMLNLSGATIRSPDGPALVADYLQTGSNVMLSDGFLAEGSRDSGTVRLIGARIGGQLVCDGGQARAAEPGELSLNLIQVRVAGELVLPASFPVGPIEVTGLTYRGEPQHATLTEWLDMLAHRTTRYTSQPYFHLAAVQAGAGHERNARMIHIARHRDLLRRGDLGLRGRVWHRITGLTAGYGYRPGRALGWLVGTLALSVVLTFVSGALGLLGGCSLVEQAGLALNAATPLVKIGEARCTVDPGRGLGQAFIALGWVLQVLAWAFLTLFVAGFTGLMRRSP